MRIEMEPAWDRVHNNRMVDTLEQYAKHQGDEQHGEGCVATTSILDALKPPALSDLTRKRKVNCNPPPEGKRRARGEGSSEPKNVTATQCFEYDCLMNISTEIMRE